MVSYGDSYGKAFTRLGSQRWNLILVLILLILFYLFYELGPLCKGTLINSTVNPSHVSLAGDSFIYDESNAGEMVAMDMLPFAMVKSSVKIQKNTLREKTTPYVDTPKTAPLTAWNNSMLYKIWQRPNSKDFPNVFKPMLNTGEVDLYAQTLHDFISNITAADINYFMYGGTLIGSYRHHGLIPWDDDIDLIVPASKKDQLLVLLNKLKPDYDFIASGPRWKFYSTKAKPVKDVKHKWPFLDICFYGMDNHTVWDADPDYRQKYSYPTSMVFPLVKRPFWNLWLNAPRDTYSFLMYTYDISQCQSARYHHKTEQWASLSSKKTIDCKELYNAFPFVFHVKTNAQFTTEVLKRGQKIIQVLRVPYNSE